jgi:hypothetical protein
MTNLRGQIITFYSYKGGVGRSAALANVATLLAQRGHRVLLMDFDLEAPGLHRYFGPRKERAEVAATADGGVIEFFCAVKEQFERYALPPFSHDAPSFEQPDNEPALRKAIQSLLVPGQFTFSRSVFDPNRNEYAGGSIALMPAGKFDANYAERVRSFPWQKLYENHPDSFDVLVDELSCAFDYVLIDSRTGTTDVGNLCTVILPEKLVLVFTMNEQSLHGAIEVGLQAVHARKNADDMRPLPIFPLPSRVENAELALQRQWLSDAQKRFTDAFRAAYGVSKDLSMYFDKVQIPHRSFYAYGEQIAAARERTTESLSLAAAFANFTKALLCNNAVDAQTALGDGWAMGQDEATPRTGHPSRFTADSRRRAAADALAAPPQGSFAPVAAPAPKRSSSFGLWMLAVAGFVAAVVLVFAIRLERDDTSPLSFASSTAERQPSEPPNSRKQASITPTVNVETPVVESSGDALPHAAATLTPDATDSYVQGDRKPVAQAKPASARPPELPPSLDDAMLSSIKLRASSAPVLNQRTPNGRQVYSFRVWVESRDRTALSRIRSVSYFFDHPSFAQKTFASSNGPRFETGYQGWGCISNVAVTILWLSGATSTLTFDQCAAI